MNSVCPCCYKAAGAAALGCSAVASQSFITLLLYKKSYICSINKTASPNGLEYAACAIARCLDLMDTRTCSP